MSDLENAILQSRDNQIKRERGESVEEEYSFTDELGITITIPIKKMDDRQLGIYIAYRASKRNKDIYVDPDDGKIHQGHNPVPIVEDRNNLLRLSASSYTRPGATAYAWEFLPYMLPKLDRSKIVIMPGLLFDRDTGEIIRTEGNELTI